MTEYRLLIGGEMVDGDGASEVINPATGASFTAVARAGERHVDAAVAAAKAAFPGWSGTSFDERAAKLVQLADVIGENRETLGRLLTQEQGKPLAEALGEIDWCVGYLQHYSTLRLRDRTLQDDDALRIEVRRAPLGVVAGIVPWNFPVLVAIWKIGPAVLTGNTVVIKTAPTTPVATLKLGELCRDVFPAGVVNIVTDGDGLGPALTAHPDVAKVSFTGSAETGRKVIGNSADTLKRLTLELGGNDAAIVLPDVDVNETAEKIYGGAFLNAGQVCLAIKRAYVHEDIYEPMVNALADIAGNAVVDDGLKQGTTQGPVQNREQFEKLKNLLESARADGRIAAGGDASEQDGYFVSPTIVCDVSDGDRIVDEEQFGPVLPVIKYSDIEEVVARANDSDYGLGGSVWSRDVERGAEIAARIEAGSVWVNQHINIGPHIPMAGCKNSGIGVEQSTEGLEEFTQIQVLNIAK